MLLYCERWSSLTTTATTTVIFCDYFFRVFYFSVIIHCSNNLTCLWPASHGSVYAKENSQESHFQKKTFRCVNLLESSCKIVEFIYNFCSLPSLEGWQKGSLIVMENIVGTVVGKSIFDLICQGWHFSKYFPKKFLRFILRSFKNFQSSLRCHFPKIS